MIISLWQIIYVFIFLFYYADQLAEPGFTDFIANFDVTAFLNAQGNKIQYRFNKMFATSAPVVWMKVKMRMCMDRLYGEKKDVSVGCV